MTGMPRPTEDPSGRGEGMKSVEPSKKLRGFNKNVKTVPSILAMAPIENAERWRLVRPIRSKMVHVYDAVSGEVFYVDDNEAFCRRVCDRLNGYEVARDFPPTPRPNLPRSEPPADINKEPEDLQ